MTDVFVEGDQVELVTDILRQRKVKGVTIGALGFVEVAGDQVLNLVSVRFAAAPSRLFQLAPRHVRSVARPAVLAGTEADG